MLEQVFIARSEFLIDNKIKRRMGCGDSKTETLPQQTTKG